MVQFVVFCGLARCWRAARILRLQDQADKALQAIRGRRAAQRPASANGVRQTRNHQRHPPYHPRKRSILQRLFSDWAFRTRNSDLHRHRVRLLRIEPQRLDRRRQLVLGISARRGPIRPARPGRCSRRRPRRTAAAPARASLRPKPSVPSTAVAACVGHSRGRSKAATALT